MQRTDQASRLGASFRIVPAVRRMNRGWSVPAVVVISLAVNGWGTSTFAQTAPAPAELAAMDLRPDVLNAMARARDYIHNTQREDGGWYYESHSAGATSLVVMTLLDSGSSTDDPSVRRALEFLRSLPEPHQVYDAAFLLMAFAQAGEEQDRPRIEKLTDFLLRAQHTAGEAGPGAWGYTIADRTSWNNSNSQLALMALQTAARLGYDVPAQAWAAARQYWLTGRNESSFGSRGRVIWTTREGNNTWRANMVMAAVASIDIATGMLDAAGVGDASSGNLPAERSCCAPWPDDAGQLAMIEGVRWLDDNFRVQDTPTSWESWHQYHLLNQSLIGRLSGRRTFGRLDWLRESTHLLLRTQNPRNGSWHDGNARQSPIVETALSLRFLAHASAPVLIGKVQYGDPGHESFGRGWNRHPRDAARLTEALVGRPGWSERLQWEVVDLARPADALPEPALSRAKLLLLCGDGPLGDLPDDQVQSLREAIDRGGCLFAVNTCGGEEFTVAMQQLVTRLFPEGGTSLQPLPASHEIYSADAPLPAVEGEPPPELWGVEFGCRLAVVYAPDDHACLWSRWTPVTQRVADTRSRPQIDRSIQLAVNVIAYATNRELHNPLDVSPFQTTIASPGGPRGRLQIARLRPASQSGASPYLLGQLPTALDAIGIRTAAGIPSLTADDARLFDIPFLVLHGRQPVVFSPAERLRLRAYLEQGGLLFADACCNSRDFDETFRRFVKETFDRPLQAIPREHELYHQSLGYDLRSIERRSSGVPNGPLTLEGLKDDQGRYFLIYSPHDLSCSLDRAMPAGRATYSHEDATRVLTNIVVYSLAH